MDYQTAVPGARVLRNGECTIDVTFALANSAGMHYIRCISTVDSLSQMAQHFLLSPAAKTLSVAQVCRMTDAQAEVAFRQLRWPEADGKPSWGYFGHTRGS